VTFGDPSWDSYPVVGDWDGDGQDTVGLYHRGEGKFYLRNSNTTGGADATAIYGNPGDIPIVGKWSSAMNYDGIGVVRNNGMHFYTYQKVESGTSGGILYDNFYAVLSTPGGIPIAGDWDGDGYDSIGVYNPDNQIWHLSNAVEGDANIDYQLTFGENGGWPFSGGWLCFGAYCTTKVTGLGYYKSGIFNLKDDLNMDSTASQITYGNTALTSGSEVWPLSGHWSQTSFSFHGTATLTPSPTATSWCGGGTGLQGLIVPPLRITSITSGDGDSSVEFGNGQGYYPDYINNEFVPRSCQGIPPTATKTPLNTPTLRPCATCPATNTPRPTNTPTPSNTLTPTVTPTPTPTTSCRVSQVLANTPLRIQTNLDKNFTTNTTNQPDPLGGNYLFVINTNSAPPFSTTLPSESRPWFWNGTVPQAVTVNSIDLIGYIGTISWIDPQVQWVYARLSITQNNGVTIDQHGYLESVSRTGTSNFILQDINCPFMTLPFPKEIPTPPSVGASSLNPVSALFRGDSGSIASAIMGSCGFHDGNITSCATPPPTSPRSTLDLVPAAIEFCIDSRDLSRLNQCDPPVANGIPIYAPVNGCLVVSSSDLHTGTFELISNCTSARVSPRTEIVLTHVKFLIPPGVAYYQSGSLIGHICRKDQWLGCGNNIDPDAAQHVAVQIRRREANGSSFTSFTLLQHQQALAHSNCLYDRWREQHSIPQYRTTSTLHACP
jgi:hypothetical protein